MMIGPFIMQTTTAKNGKPGARFHYLLSFIPLFISRTTFYPGCEWRWSVTKSLNVSNYCQYQYLFIWFIEMHHLVPIICSSFLFHRPGHISIRADTKSPVTCYYNIGGGRNEPWHVFWTRQGGGIQIYSYSTITIYTQCHQHNCHRQSQL